MYKQTILPNYKGFNLSYLMVPQIGEDKSGQNVYREELRKKNPVTYELINSDLEMIADLGFNFVRLPLNYINFTKNYDKFWEGESFEFDEKEIEKIDKAIERAIELGIYVQFSLHRAPGYTVGGIDHDPYKLWVDDVADAAFSEIWRAIAERYKGVAAEKMGFNLVNEPYSDKAGRRLLSLEIHNNVMQNAVQAIRSMGDKRIVFVDGTNWGRDYLLGLCDMEGVAQSCRAYDPKEITHFSNPDNEVENTFVKWPDMPGKEVHTYDKIINWTKEILYNEFEPWARMAQKKKVGVHCGEGGVSNTCPRNVALSWFSDVNDILDGFNIGLALWELRGIYGIIDSERTDCKYVDYKGHLLDKEMMNIMKKGI